MKKPPKCILSCDSSGVQLRAPAPAQCLLTLSCSLPLSGLVNAVKTATRHGVNMANGLFRNSLHLVSQLRYVRVSRRLHAMQCDGIRFDLMPRVLALFLILLFFCLRFLLLLLSLLLFWCGSQDLKRFRLSCPTPSPAPPTGQAADFAVLFGQSA